MEELRDELLTVAEAAKLLKVTPHTVYRWIAVGRLPAVKYSRRVIRIRREDLGLVEKTRWSTSSVQEYSGVREASAVAYSARPDSPPEKLESEDIVLYYRERVRALQSRRRSPGDPPKGSSAALLRHVGVISEEDGAELWRVIKQDREASANDPVFEFE